MRSFTSNCVGSRVNKPCLVRAQRSARTPVLSCPLLRQSHRSLNKTHNVPLKNSSRVHVLTPERTTGASSEVGLSRGCSLLFGSSAEEAFVRCMIIPPSVSHDVLCARQADTSTSRISASGEAVVFSMWVHSGERDGVGFPRPRPQPHCPLYAVG